MNKEFETLTEDQRRYVLMMINDAQREGGRHSITIPGTGEEAYAYQAIGGTSWGINNSRRLIKRGIHPFEVAE